MFRRPLVLLASFCAASFANAQTLELSECRISAGPGASSMKARCGTMVRPLDPTGAVTGEIELRVAVVPALNLTPETDPLVPIAGGPGQGSVQFYTAYSRAFEDVRRNRDILLIDQRGTGESSTMDCKFDDSIVEDDYSTELTIEHTQLCLDELPHDPRFFTTSVAVTDLEAVREALGYQKLNLYATQFPLTEQILLTVDPVTNAIRFALENDSSMLSKASQTTELNVGYSRHAWSNDSGSLYLGAEAKLYLMRLSRFSVRFGDITDSEELFEAIRDSNFRNDERLGVDIGALWVGENYQVGFQLTNVNEPKFTFPDVNLDSYTNDGIIGFLQSDQSYTMDRQSKLEASLFTTDRRWSTHLGYDADSATDPMGDKYQWLTLSAGFTTDSWWIPGGRIGYRENLAGTKLKYIGIGLTAFKIVNFDISSALHKVSIDGRTLPQGLMTSIGFQISW